MKVCMHILNPARVSGRAIRAATALAIADIEVTLIDMEHSSLGKASQNPGTFILIAREEPEIKNLRFQHIHLPGRFIRYYEPVSMVPWLLFKVLRVFLAVFTVLRTSADIYYACDLAALPACYIAAVLRRKPLIFETYDTPLVLPHIARKRLLHTVSAFLLRRMVARCNAVLVPSPPLVKEMQRLYGGPTPLLLRSTPLYQPPVISNRLRQSLNLGEEVRIALYQGKMRGDRGLDVLVRAARFIDPNIVIVLMGRGESQPALASLIEQEGVEERIKIIPPAPYEDLLSWTASADLGLIIYRAQSANVPMMLPNKLFEYMMAGVPVLASPLVSVVEIVERYDVGAIIHSLDPAEVGAAINAMLADREALARMRSHALAACERELRWDVESQHLVQLCQKLAGG
ncbi:MAG TPA: glycosyltransferase [Ktedonosporobacter sp.]|nr:glycosyltransferase [Ktedonosporobacter sp.]